MTSRSGSPLLLLALALPLAATPIFYSTNGTAAPTFTSGLSWDASSVIAGTDTSVAMQFVAGLNGTVASIVAPLSGNVSDVTFVLRMDASGMTGAIIDTFTFTGVTSSIQLLTASSTTNAALVAGTSYWLEMVAPTPAATTRSSSWYFSSPPVSGMVEVDNPAPAVTSNTIAAFAVLGADVPEPATVTLMALAGGLLLLRLRKRRPARSGALSLVDGLLLLRRSFHR